MHPSAEAFSSLVSSGYKRIPVTRTILADTETPVSAYNKLARGHRSFLFESVQGGERWGRYSIIGLPAKSWLSVRGCKIQYFEDEVCVRQEDCDDPLTHIDRLTAEFKSAPALDLPVFHGGYVGYFSYESIRYIEPKLADDQKEDPLDLPDILLLLSEEVLIFDNLAGTLRLVVNVNCNQVDGYELAQLRLDELVSNLESSGPSLDSLSISEPAAGKGCSEIAFSTSRANFEGWVERIRDYIVEGDVMQVVASQRMTIPFVASPLSLYRALRNLNPSPYMYFLDLANFQIVGSSPEILVRYQSGHITVRPIAGTRPRGGTEEQDQALALELLADEKEAAEHLMLIDLGRNDVGRISEKGTVALTERMVVERYSHVMHMVSNVTGRARNGISAIDALKATLPAGTLSGAPKFRAMEIINELEPVKRGVYGGAIGYLSWKGDMDTAIAIRTAVIQGGKMTIQAGAGIVADSVPALEWEETLNKARALLNAAQMCDPSEK